MEEWQTFDDGLFGSHCSEEGSCTSHLGLMQILYGDDIRQSSSCFDSQWPMSRKRNYNFYLNEDIAIRKYCAARLESQQQHQCLDEVDMELVLRSGSPLLDSAQHDEMIDSFINIEETSKSEDTNSYSTARAEETKNKDKECRFPALVLDLVDSERVQVIKSSEGQVDRGLQLVHLLLACAEAVGCRDSELAATLLQQIWKSAHPEGDSLQRVIWCFARGLTSRLSLLLHNSNSPSSTTVQFPDLSDIMTTPSKAERAEAFQLLYQCTPYIAFGFMAANEAIVEAAKGKNSLHILDLGLVQGLQWPALIRKLGSRPEGPPSVRLTAMEAGSISEFQEWKTALAEEAKTLGMPLEFHLITEPLNPSMLNPLFLQLRDGESLIINSVLQLHKFVKESRSSLRCVLQAMHRLNPCIVTLVEQDANHNGPFFLGRFLESLHYYSAIFDSLEASLPRSSPQRMKVERFQFAEEISNIVACEGGERIERHERADQWRRQLGRSGFQAVPLRFMSQVRMMLSVYGCDGYSLAEEKGCLLLGWKGRTIMLASAWRPNAHTNSHFS